MPSVHSQRQGEVSRVTRSGRKITYCLNVIQQPERARACGAGAKCEQSGRQWKALANNTIASADRRPVDPPPVVELKVFEGEGEKKEDITFSYEANFFLFASLEAARPIAHARHQPAPPQQPPPVLTGMPVSGMAYLDRPREAGYFIFPDLSVRHEGRYKLSFNLYEQTKREHDLDVEQLDGQSKAPNGNESPDSSFDFRMEVKSDTFNVWSAKKFPGLKESTQLSRQVAEQGCRVRIRRDVRMRRRGEGKPGDYEEPYEEQYARGRAAEEAERVSRSRSSSASGLDGTGPNGQPYYQPNNPGNNLNFLGNSSQFAAPPPPFPGPQHNGPPQHQHAPPPPPSHAPHHYQQQAPSQSSYSRPQPAHQNSYQYDRSYPQSAYPANARRDTFEHEARRASAPQPPREYPPSVETSSHRASIHHPIAPHRPYNGPPPPSSPFIMAPMKLNEPRERQPSLPSFQAPAIPSFQGPIVPDPYLCAPEPVKAGGKRGFDNAFRQSSIASSQQPLHNGQRPSIAHVDAGPQNADEDDDEYSIDSFSNMEYKRADGRGVRIPERGRDGERAEN